MSLSKIYFNDKTHADRKPVRVKLKRYYILTDLGLGSCPKSKNILTYYMITCCLNKVPSGRGLMINMCSSYSNVGPIYVLTEEAEKPV